MSFTHAGLGFRGFEVSTFRGFDVSRFRRFDVSTFRRFDVSTFWEANVIRINFVTKQRSTMVLLELDPFLSALTKMYEQSKDSGTIWVTLKRSTLQRQKKRETIEEKPAQVPEPSEFRCLVRATDGKNRISCSLTAKNHLRFQTSYATVLKAHMDSLKKKEKNDKKEKRTTTTKTLVS